MKIQLFGDVSFDGLYCDPQNYESIRKNFEYVESILAPADFRIANWESPLWGDGELNELKSPRLSTTLGAAETILPLNIDLMLLGNNHTFDCGYKGFSNTVEFFKKNSLEYIGAGETIDEAQKPHVFFKNGKGIGVLNFVSEKTNPKMPENGKVILNSFSLSKAIGNIKSLLHDIDNIIVILHWGEIELTRIPSLSQREVAKELINAGAKAVVGSHVHTLQGWEHYKDGLIIYSIGNFVFNPYLVMPGYIHSKRPLDTRRIGIPEIIITDQELSVSWNYFYREDDSLILIPDDENRVRKFHKRLNKLLIQNLSIYKFLYFIETKLVVVRSFFSKNGGFPFALLKLKPKHFKMIRGKLK